ncbi:MAG TPA: ROK family protein [Acidimicrobiales bacterium]|nr:ROK family protein [Acidimicrobiales bacterium]
MSLNGEPVTLCLALDIGATKMEAGFVDKRGDILRSEGSSTPPGDDAERIFLEVTRLLDGLLGSDGNKPSALGVGCAGPVNNRSEVSPLNIPAWRGFPLRLRLEERYGLPTFLELDTKALALAEGWRGAARGSQNYLAMVVSSGIGGGLVLDGRLVEGRTGNAGHVGHVIVEQGGRPCSCGGKGCLEAEASGWAIASITGRPPSEAGADMVERTGRLVGVALASVANLCDLDLFVVAGSVALGYGGPFFEAASSALHENAKQSYARTTRVVPAGLGKKAPLVGAAAVGWRGLGEELLAEILK